MLQRLGFLPPLLCLAALAALQERLCLPATAIEALIGPVPVGASGRLILDPLEQERMLLEEVLALTLAELGPLQLTSELSMPAAGMTGEMVSTYAWPNRFRMDETQLSLGAALHVEMALAALESLSHPTAASKLPCSKLHASEHPSCAEGTAMEAED